MWDCNKVGRQVGATIRRMSCDRRSVLNPGVEAPCALGATACRLSPRLLQAASPLVPVAQMTADAKNRAWGRFATAIKSAPAAVRTPRPTQRATRQSS